MKLYKPDNGIVQLLFTKRAIQITWPTICFKPYGFQVLADTAIRIHPSAGAYGLIVLGFGIATIRTLSPLKSYDQ